MSGLITENYKLKKNNTYYLKIVILAVILTF